MEFKWIQVCEPHAFRTYRAKVFGGWIVRTYDFADIAACAMVFIPDPKHEWEIDK